jgi:hypothetical protein
LHVDCRDVRITDVGEIAVPVEVWSHRGQLSDRAVVVGGYRITLLNPRERSLLPAPSR